MGRNSKRLEDEVDKTKRRGEGSKEEKKKRVKAWRRR